MVNEGSGKSTVPVVNVEAKNKKPEEAQLAASPQVFYIWGNGNGVFDLRTNLPGVNRYSYVVASITEVTPNTIIPFLGNARMTVNNVVPLDGGTVQFRVTIDWPNPLPFWINGFWQ